LGILKYRIPFRVQPMLATLVAKPFHNSGWTYEEKYDGERALAYKEGERVRLLSRNGKDTSARFPKVVQAIAKLRPPSLLLDGEVVVFDRAGVSRFQLLQQGKGEPVYAVFDCLYVDGKDLRDQPLSRRRQAVEQVIKSQGVLIRAHQLATNGLEAYRIAKRRGYEGLVAKDLSSRYLEKRSSLWLKVKVHQEDEFVIVGYTAPQGSRAYFGALLLGAYDRGKLRYVGKVGTGFTEATLRALFRKMEPLVGRHPELEGLPRERNVKFLAPRLVAQISYQELTADQKLRQPVFLGLREDKRAQDVVLPKPGL